MANLIAICDTEKSKLNLSYLVNELSLDSNMTWMEFREKGYNKEFLSSFKVIIFVLNPNYIVDSFFIKRLKDITNDRQNTKSIYFVIDDTGEFDKRDILKGKLEIEKATKDIIDSPSVMVISSLLASEYKKYNTGLTKLENIRKNRHIFYLDKAGFPVCGNNIEEKDVLMFKCMSGIDNLIANINRDINDLENIDVNKVQWCVVGNKKCGKTTFINNIKNLNKNLEMIEYEDYSSLKVNISEGIVIILNTNHQDNIRLLKEIDDKYLEAKKIVILNKVDEFMYSDDYYIEFVKKVSSYVKKCLNEDIHILSSYYTKRWIELEKDSSKLEEIKGDQKLLLLDKFYIPIIKFNSDKEFLREFKRQNYLKELVGVEKILCLNHLQK